MGLGRIHHGEMEPSNYDEEGLVLRSGDNAGGVGGVASALHLHLIILSYQECSRPSLANNSICLQRLPLDSECDVFLFSDATFLPSCPGLQHGGAGHGPGQRSGQDSPHGLARLGEIQMQHGL